MKHRGFKKIEYVAWLLILSLIISGASPVMELSATGTTGTSGTTGTTGTGTTGTTGTTTTVSSRCAPEKYHRYGVTYGEFTKKTPITAGGYLLVGTYLIDMVPTEEMIQKGEQAITGEIYQAALTSKLTYSQNVCFYKSELANKEWRDIDAADRLSVITTNAAKTVTEAEMKDMLITVFVSGGKSESTNPDSDNKDDGSRKNPFLEPSPYNLDEMPEMAVLLSMTTDNSLAYSETVTDQSQVGINQSNRFMSERLKYMFAHDEVTNTIKLRKTDGEKAKVLNEALSTQEGNSDNKAVEKQFDETEKLGGVFLDPIKNIANDKSKRDLYSTGDDGRLSAASRLVYHFSDTRDELTDIMDKAVVNLWEVYLEYKDAAEAAGEELDSFKPEEDKIYNKDKYNFLYSTISTADSVRRGEAYYNLAVNEDFHGGTGSVLSNIKMMAEEGRSNVGRNLHNTSYYVPLAEKNKVKTGGFVKNENLTKAIDEAIEYSKNKYVDYSAYTFARGNSALSQYIYDEEMKIIDKTKKDDVTDTVIENLIYASNIKSGNIKSKKKEAEMLYAADANGKVTGANLIGKQNTIFAEYIAQGLPANYRIIGSKEEDLRALLLSQQSTGKNAEKAMEKLVDAYLLREQDKPTYTKLLNAQLTWVRNQKKRIQDTDYAPYAEEIRYAYEQFIINKMRELGLEVPGEDDGNKNIDWDAAKQRALDDNDPNLAKNIDNLKDKYEKDGSKTPDGYTPSIDIDPHTGLPYVKYTKDDNGNGTGSGSGSGGGNGNGKDGKGDKNSGSGSGSGGKSDGTGGNGDGADVNGNGNGFGDNDAGKNNGGGDGNGGGSGLPVPNGDMLDNLLAKLGMSFDDMDPQAQAELVCALNQYGRENKNEEALTLARNLLSKIMFNKNPLVYTKYKGNTDMEFVSFGAVDRARRYTRFRLVREGLDITMTRMDLGLTYVFRYGTVEVKMLSGVSEEMLNPLTSQTDTYLNRGSEMRHPYLDEEDAQAKLNCRAEYIEDVSYAICVTASMEPRIKEIVALLVDMYK